MIILDDSLPPELEVVSLDLKLAPPSTDDGGFCRARIGDALGPPRPVTLVVAPAGYGKSRAVADWVGDLDKPVAWLTLDEGDRDPARFWFQVAAAIWRATGSDIPAETLTALRSPAGMAPAVRLTPLINLFSRSAHGCVLVLDDYQRAEVPEVDESLAYLVRFQPPDLDLIITSRSRPELGLARLVADGRLHEIGAERLAFDVDETARALAGRGIETDPGLVERVHTVTGGWPVAVGLVAFGLARAQPGSMIDGLPIEAAGRSRPIAEYLAQEILNGLDPDEIEVVQRTSILERLSGPLVDRVVDGVAGGALLEDLDRRGLPMERLDDHRGWYRYHRLVADEAAHRLRARVADEEIRRLHGRASGWFVEAGRPDDALHHALLADDRGTAAELVVERWLPAVNRGEVDTVRSWLARLGSVVVDADPRLAVADAWVGVMSGDVADVEARLAAARSAPPNDTEHFFGASDRASAVALVESTYFRLLGRLGDAAAAATTALAVETDAADRGRARALAYAGVVTFWRSQFDEAELQLNQAVGTAARFDNHIAQLLASGYLALLAVERGESVEARRRVDAALAIAERQDLGYHPAVGPTYAAQAILAGHDDPEAGLPLFDRAAAVAAIQSEPALVAYLHLARARALSALGRSDEADHEMFQASALARSHPDIGFVRARTAVTVPTGTEPAADPSERELAVLRMLTTPLSAAEIASELYVSHNTVKTQIRSLYRKLGVSRRADAVRVGTELGLL